MDLLSKKIKNMETFPFPERLHRKIMLGAMYWRYRIYIISGIVLSSLIFILSFLYTIGSLMESGVTAFLGDLYGHLEMSMDFFQQSLTIIFLKISSAETFFMGASGLALLALIILNISLRKQGKLAGNGSNFVRA